MKAPERKSHPDAFSNEMRRKAGRKLEAKRRSRHGVWFGLGMFGLIGWSIAIPALAGIALGLWADRTWPGTVSWTLTLMTVGVALGCVNAWRWLKRGGRL